MDKDWDQFTPEERKAAQKLGYTKRHWDDEIDVSSVLHSQNPELPESALF